MLSALKKGEIDSSKKHRVLVVDDNRDSAQTLIWIIEIMGHDAIMTHNGPSALEAAHSFKPDIVLLDIGLPGMNGHEICQVMRRDPVFAHTIFVAQTGWGQPEHIEQSRAAGFDYHLVKPVKAEDLEAILSPSIDNESRFRLAQLA